MGVSRQTVMRWERLRQKGGRQAHRSKLVRAHVEAQRRRIVLGRLRACAPEMNPVECIWGYRKYHAMPNYIVGSAH